jgi:tetraacyldisaccharide 4'-kinase
VRRAQPVHDKPVSAAPLENIAEELRFCASRIEAANIAAPVRRSFPDHHRYTQAEAAALVAEAERRHLALVTTEKDLARLTGDPAVAPLARTARALPVTLTLDDADGLRDFVLARLPG